MSELSMQFLNQIIDYIEDWRYKQAVLIDGAWGCGKTFFVKNELIPELKKKDFVVYPISLYGISNISDIQDSMYAIALKQMSEKTDEEENDTAISKGIETIKGLTAKGLALFGKTLLKMVENKTGFDGNNVIEKIKEKITFFNADKMVLIFDDIERCNIDIIELMGFLNNLSENNDFKIVLVAFEKEIEKKSDKVSQVLQYHLIKDLYNDEISPTKKSDANIISHITDEDIVNRIETHRNTLFKNDTRYNCTKEKLIGLTIRYVVNLEEVYDVLVDKYVGNNKDVSGTRKDFFINHKNDVINVFTECRHLNLRTLINTLICVDKIIDRIEGLTDVHQEGKDEFLDGEKVTILTYAAYENIQLAEGKPLRDWDGKRYGRGKTGVGFLMPGQEAVLGYAFVDEYIYSHTLNDDIIKNDVFGRIKNLVESNEIRIRSDEHTKLTLFMLREWYYMDDAEIESSLKSLKTELTEGKYYPEEYKDIIYVLMCIRNPNFGMKPSHERYDSGDIMYESAMPDFPEIQFHTSDEEILYPFEFSVEIDISDYVSAMTKDIRQNNKTVTREMLNIMSEDYSFVKEFRDYEKPLLEIIDEQEKSNLVPTKEETDSVVGFDAWDEELYSFCKNHKNEYMNKGQFLSLYSSEQILKKLENASAREIDIFIETLESVYSFSNLGDVFIRDLPVVKYIKEEMKKDSNNGHQRFNCNQSRTKEIGLRQLEYEFEKYYEGLDVHSSSPIIR